jgi:threonine dehydrogenase-like Zn-dependent dehydrogenase
MVRPEGIIVLKSTCAAGAEFNTAPFVIDEVTVIGSRCGPFDKAIELLETGAVSVGKFITATYPLSAGLQALDHARSPGSLKIQLEMGRRQQRDGERG